MKILIINGPNLNLLGKRERSIYGNELFEDFYLKLKKSFPETELNFFQSNIEGELIDEIQSAEGIYDGIILNAGGYTHTSVAIGDAIKAVMVPVIEVHISNIHSREDYRSHSMISSGVKGIVIGFGLESYRIAIQAFINKGL
jgi:3-dehydroquinate dehydratase-2